MGGGGGGYWERLIQGVKHYLRKIIGWSTLNFDKLAIILIEIESTLNNRCYVYLYGDNEGHIIASVITNHKYEVVSTAKSLMKRAKYQCHILNNFIKQ